MAKNRIPHTTFEGLVKLQIANRDEILRHHVEQGPCNAQYTSKFSSHSLLVAIDSWIDSNLVISLQASQYFTIMADECEDISTQEELSICCRWAVDGHAEEHFMTILHIKSLDAEFITAAITAFVESKGFRFRKLIGQGYDGAYPFSGKNTGVQKRICMLAGHAVYIHCSCHRLQLASIQAAESVPQIKRMFGMMINLWKVFLTPQLRLRNSKRYRQS